MFKADSEQSTITLPGVRVHKAYLTASSAKKAPKIMVHFLPKAGSSVKHINFNVPGTASSMTPNEVAKKVEAYLLGSFEHYSMPSGLRKLQELYPKPDMPLAAAALPPPALVVGGARRGAALGPGLGQGGDVAGAANMVAVAGAANMVAGIMYHPALVNAAVNVAQMEVCESLVGAATCRGGGLDGNYWNYHNTANSNLSFYSKEEQLRLYGDGALPWQQERWRIEKGFKDMSKLYGVARGTPCDPESDADDIMEQVDAVVQLTVQEAIRKSQDPTTTNELKEKLKNYRIQVKAFEREKSSREKAEKEAGATAQMDWGPKDADPEMTTRQLQEASLNITNQIRVSSDANFQDAAKLVQKASEHPNPTPLHPAHRRF